MKDVIRLVRTHSFLEVVRDATDDTSVAVTDQRTGLGCEVRTAADVVFLVRHGAEAYLAR